MLRCTSSDQVIIATSASDDRWLLLSNAPALRGACIQAVAHAVHMEKLLCGGCCGCVLLQGILSSFFYKFADTILKKYSSTIATIFTAIMSFVMFGHALTVNFLLGVSIVFISMHQVCAQLCVYARMGGGTARACQGRA